MLLLIVLFFYSVGLEHVLLGFYGVLFAAYYEVYVAPLLWTLAWKTLTTDWDSVVDHDVLGEFRHRHKRCSTVQGQEALFVLAHAQGLVVDEHVFDSYLVHVFVDDGVPTNLTLDLTLIIIAEHHLTLHAKSFLYLRGHIKSKQIPLQKPLFHNIVKQGYNVLLGYFAIRETYDGVELEDVEDVLLVFYEAELVVLDQDRAWAIFVLTALKPEPDVVSHEVAIEGAGAEVDLGPLLQHLGRAGLVEVVEVMLAILEGFLVVDAAAENPGVGTSSIEQSSELLWRIADPDVRAIGAVAMVGTGQCQGLVSMYLSQVTHTRLLSQRHRLLGLSSSKIIIVYSFCTLP